MTTVDHTYTTTLPIATPTPTIGSPADDGEACEVPTAITSTVTVATSTTTIYPETTTTVYIDEDEATTGVPTYTGEDEATTGVPTYTGEDGATTGIPTYTGEDEATTGVPTYTGADETTTIAGVELTMVPSSTRKTSTSYITTTIPTTSVGIATYNMPAGTSTVTVTPTETITISTKYKGVSIGASTYAPPTYPSAYPSVYPGNSTTNTTTPYPMEAVSVYTGAASRQTVGLGLLSMVIAGVLGAAALL